MIIPFFFGLVSPLRAPMTWALFVMNLGILILTQINMAGVQSKLEAMAEDTALADIQGRIFASYVLENKSRYPASYVQISEEALIQSDSEKTQLLGALALRDSEFYSEKNPYLFSSEARNRHVDVVEQVWWQSKSKELQLIRQSHSGYVLGITKENQSALQWLTYQFVHSDESHFLVNMIVFLIFGAALELIVGPIALLAVFLLSGVGAAFVYLMIDQVSAIPLIGASGAVSGVVALFCVLFWNHGLRNFYFLFVPARGFTGFVYVPGWLVLILWIVADFAGFFSTPGEIGGVAHSAHIGGQVTGALLALLVILYFRFRPARWNLLVNRALKLKMLGPKMKAEGI